ncbi:MAG: hypothetical protein WCG26_03880 [Chloroflexales bacterium]
MRPKMPMPPALARWIGATLIGAGLLGLLLSLAGLIFVVSVGTAAEGALMRELTTLDQALAATSDGLTVADSTLADTRRTLTALGTTLDDATTALTATMPTVIALKDLTGTSLPQTLGTTRQALASAQATAKVVDDVLRTVAMFGVAYDPAVPLNVALGQVADSLGELPTTLGEMSAGLGTAHTQLGLVASDLGEVSAGVASITTSVNAAATVVGHYQTVVGNLRGEVAAVREAAPGWMMLTRGGLILLLIWLGLAQIGLLTQGWALLADSR